MFTRTFTNAQGDTITDGVIDFINISKHCNSSYERHLDVNNNPIVNQRSNTHINYTPVYWMSQENKDANLAYYQLQLPSNSNTPEAPTSYHFSLSDEYKTVYDETVGTEDDKVMAVCIAHFDSLIA